MSSATSYMQQVPLQQSWASNYENSANKPFESSDDSRSCAPGTTFRLLHESWPISFRKSANRPKAATLHTSADGDHEQGANGDDDDDPDDDYGADANDGTYDDVPFQLLVKFLHEVQLYSNTGSTDWVCSAVLPLKEGDTLNATLWRSLNTQASS